MFDLLRKSDRVIVGHSHQLWEQSTGDTLPLIFTVLLCLSVCSGRANLNGWVFSRYSGVMGRVFSSCAGCWGFVSVP